MIIGLALNYVGLNAIKMLFWSAVAKGLLAPPLAVLVVLVTSDKKVMGNAPTLVVRDAWVDLRRCYDRGRSGVAAFSGVGLRKLYLAGILTANQFDKFISCRHPARLFLAVYLLTIYVNIKCARGAGP
jgi:Mn2+/Fe2+ NRAMP family transporter